MTTQEQKAIIGDLYIRSKKLKRESVCILSKIEDASEDLKTACEKIQEAVEKGCFEESLPRYPSYEEVEALLQKAFNNSTKQKKVKEKLEGF